MRVFALLLIVWTATVYSINVANEIRQLIVNDADEDEVLASYQKWMTEKSRVPENSCTVSITAPKNSTSKNPTIKWSVKCGGESLAEGSKKKNWLKPINLKQGIHLFSKTLDGSTTYLLLNSDKVDFDRIELLDLPGFGSKYAAPMVAQDANFELKNCSIMRNQFGLQAGALLMTGGSTATIDSGEFYQNRGTVGAIRIKDSSHLTLETSFILRSTGTMVGGTMVEDDGVFIARHVLHAENSAEGNLDKRIEAVSGGILFTGDSTGLCDDCTFKGNALDKQKKQQLLDTTILEDDIIGNTLPKASALKLEESSNVIILKSTFEKSTAKNGAVMTSDSSVLTLNTAKFVDNAAIRGGGLYVEGGRGSFAKTRRTIFENNIARYGGAMVVAGNGSFAIDTCNFAFNEALQGGAIWGDYSNTAAGSCKRAAQGSRVDIRTSTFTNNKAVTNGGAFFIKCTDIQSQDTTFTNNEANLNGGVMYAENTYDLNFINCTFDNNTAKDSGGSLFVKKSHDILNDRCTFINSKANNNGGAISSIEGNGIYVRECSIVDNIAGAKDGGAIHSEQVMNIEVTESDLMRNTAGESGGALSVHDLIYVKVEDVNVTGNTASRHGGAIHISEGKEAWISNMNISGIVAGRGAISMLKMGSVYVSDIEFTDNHATNQCGALELDGATSAELTDLLFHSNKAASLGGSLCLSHADSATVNNTEFTHNVAGEGGAIYMDGGTDVSIVETTFDRNFGKIKGGAIRGDNVKSLTLENTKFEMNRAKLRGAAVHMEKSSLNIQQSRFSDNFVGSKAVMPKIEEVEKVPSTTSKKTGEETKTKGTPGEDAKTRKKSTVKEPATDDNAISSGDPVSVINGHAINFVIVSGGTVSMDDGDTFTSMNNFYFQNGAEHIGGMLMLEDMKTVWIQYDSFIGGVAKLSGGCIYGMHLQNFSLWDSKLEHCRAHNGGAFILEGTSVANGGYNKFINNTASSGGAFLCKGNSKVDMEATNFSYNAAPEGATAAVSCICNIDFHTSAFYREKELRGNGDFFHIDKGCGSVNHNGCEFYGKMDKKNRLTALHWIGICLSIMLIFFLIFAVYKRRQRRKEKDDIESQKPLLGHRIEIEVSEEESSEYETTDSEYDKGYKSKGKKTQQPTTSKAKGRRYLSSDEDSTEDSLLETEESETEEEMFERSIEKEKRDSVDEEPLPPLGLRSAKEQRAAARRRHASTVSVNDGAGPSSEAVDEVLPPPLPKKLSLSLSMDQEPTVPSNVIPDAPEEKQEEETRQETIHEEAASDDANSGGDDDTNSPTVSSPFNK